MDADERERFERFMSPGGAGWFIELVGEVQDGHGYRPRADLLAEDLAERWADFASLLRPARLRWARAVKIEIDHRSAAADVREIAEACEMEDEDMVRVLCESFPKNVVNLKELTDDERREWVHRAKLAARGKLMPDAIDELAYRRADLVCSAAAEIVSGIYFVTADRQMVKIGYASNVASRLRTLQTASHRPLHLLVVISGTQADERQLHRRFADFRVQGEWFRLVPEIEAFIAAENIKADK